MKTGWVYVDNKWYYLSESGVMKTGWINDSKVFKYIDVVF